MTALERRAKEVFLDALDRPALERSTFLDTACANDASLRQRVDELLRLHDETSGGADGGRAIVDLEPGACIGPYRLVSRLGEGGFGVVFLAEQEQPVKRQVALKVVKLGMDTRRVIARFEHERQTLALMDHPNIAKVLDAGATESGRPYFVMERVDGKPLTEYCSRNHLDLETRLQMFVQVCLAVQHAHQRGVIHRDLKPSNVLVAEIDGVAVPKVIDFGIAKAVEGELADHTAYTGEGQALGTPAYMSPEQMEATRDVDTRSDVYSLGVILYQLLSDALPFDPESLGLDAIRNAVLHDDPPAPSARIRASRGTTALSGIPRDLDWVVLRCLAKDRDRRYQSAAALAKDVERVLAHAPVEAAPPSLGYRARKFVRRHRVATVAGSVVLLAIIGAGTAVSLALIQSRHDQRLASNLNEFLVNDVLCALLPSQSLKKGADVSMREVLDTAAARIDSAAEPGARLHDEPLVVAALHTSIGQSYIAIGRPTEGEKHLAIAEALQRQQRGNEASETLGAINLHALALRAIGNFEECERLLREIIVVDERRLGPNDPELAVPLHGLARALAFQSKWREAEEVCRRILAMVPDDEDVDHQGTRANVGAVLGMCDHDDEAYQLFRRAYDVHRRLIGPLDLETLPIADNLAIAEARRDHGDEAARLFEEVLEVQARVYGDNHPETIFTLYHLGELRLDSGDVDAAERLFTRDLDAARIVHGPKHISTWLAMSGISRVRLSQHRPAEADASARDALALVDETPGENGPIRLQLITDLARALADEDRMDESVPLLRQAVDVCGKTYGPEHPNTRSMRHDLAKVLRMLHRDDEADEVETDAASEPASEPADPGGG